uniref:Core Histone H2A/H2B/H3 domain-containing protein n=1 Tax=Kalanchoe fedtschenkoi TaxID=63787 RepID=A0A7N0TL71_KALFE
QVVKETVEVAVITPTTDTAATTLTRDPALLSDFNSGSAVSEVVKEIVQDKLYPEADSGKRGQLGQRTATKSVPVAEKQQPKTEAKPKPEKQQEEKKRRRRRRGKMGEEVGYKRYMFRVLKQVHPGVGISGKAMTVLNGFMNDMFERLAGEAARLTDYTARRTMSAREVQWAVRLVLRGELGKHAVAEGTKAVSNYVSYSGGGAK